MNASLQEKYETSRKLVFELKNELNEKNSANLSASKELEIKNTTITELKEALSKEIQNSKNK